ncbi:MAG: CRISPR-associated endonuclease Cas1 [Parvularcula sp.]
MVQPGLSDICRLDRLLEAWAKVKANRGAPGGDGVTWAMFDKNALVTLDRLAKDVGNGSYRPRAIRRVHVTKRQGGRRPLAIPSIIDRVLQTAVATALTPVFEAEFEPQSYGYRPGRSVAMAVSRVEVLRRQGYRWTVDADILRYFERVPHDLLMIRVRRIVEDEPLCDLIALWLRHAEADGVGLAQGSPLSPLLANLYLDELDEALEGSGVRIIRFADDFVLLCKSEESAQTALFKAQKTLQKLGLELNLEKTHIRSYDESLTFLGRLFVRSLMLEQERGTDRSQPASAQSSDTRPALSQPARSPDATGEEGQFLPSAPRTHSSRIRTLYVYERGMVLSADGPHFVVRRDGEERLRLPARQLHHIDVGPNAEIMGSALRLAAATQINLTISDGWGHAAARLDTGPDGGARLHLQQAAQILDDAGRLKIARAFVEARLRGQRALLRTLNRKRKLETVGAAATSISRILRALRGAKSVEQLMGFEGQAGALYWPTYGACFLHGRKMKKRSRRPPGDPINLALSFLSERLTNDMRVLVTRHGLHPGFGYLHAVQDRERETLVLDMVEIFRAPLVEGLVVYLFNNRMLKEEHFVWRDGPIPIRLVPDAAEILIRSYENRLSNLQKSPFSDKTMTWRGVMEEQVNEIRDAIEEERVPMMLSRMS